MKGIEKFLIINFVMFNQFSMMQFSNILKIEN